MPAIYVTQVSLEAAEARALCSLVTAPDCTEPVLPGELKHSTCKHFTYTPTTAPPLHIPPHCPARRPLPTSGFLFLSWARSVPHGQAQLRALTLPTLYYNR